MKLSEKQLKMLNNACMAKFNCSFEQMYQSIEQNEKMKKQLKEQEKLKKKNEKEAKRLKKG